MLFGRTKKAEKGNTKGLIEIKKEQLAEVQAELDTLTNECLELQQQNKRYEVEGETFKALEVQGQLELKFNRVMKDLNYKRQKLLEDLGGVAYGGYCTGLVGEANLLERDISMFEKKLKAYKGEIEAEKSRAAERIEKISQDIEEAQAEIENASQRLNELLGG